MTDSARIEALDDDLRWLGRRLSRAGFDPTRTLRRRRLEEYRYLAWAVFLLLVLVGAIYAGAWRGIALFALAVVPNAFGRWRAARAERSALTHAEGFLELELEHVQKRLSSERGSAVFNVLFAVVLAFASTTEMRGAPVFPWFAAFSALHGAWRLVWRVPALKRELEELGGKDELGWFGPLFTVAFLLMLPLLVPLRLAWRGIQRLRGVEGLDDEDDDADAADAEEPETSSARRSVRGKRGDRK
ncbi:MAG: hypothetical protein L6Q99_20380 [Planctomycetes bacterium]|nr:hypothetical protein [Planctomycetota bacterium]